MLKEIMRWNNMEDDEWDEESLKMYEAKSGEKQVWLYVCVWGGGGGSKDQSYSELPKTHCSFGIFEIQ